MLEAGGKPEPWAEKKRPVWEKPPVLICFAVFAVVLLVTSAVLAMKIGGRDTRIAALEKRIAEQPLLPATSTS